MFTIAPWVEAGIVTVIPSPMDFDPVLRNSMWELAEKRLEASGLKSEDLFTEEEIRERGMKTLRKFTYRLPEPQLRQWIATNTPPDAPKGISIDEMVDYIKRERENDPLLVDQDVDLKGELAILRNGSNLEGGFMISELTGSYLYASSATEWRQLSASAQEDTSSPKTNWRQLSGAFQELDFKFFK